MENTAKMLCLTIYSYKKAGLSDEEYREYMLKTHAPLASTLMEKYGIVGFTMVCLFVLHQDQGVPYLTISPQDPHEQQHPSNPHPDHRATFH